MRNKYKVVREFTYVNNYKRFYKYELYIYDEYLCTFNSIDEIEIYIEEYEKGYIIEANTLPELIKKIKRYKWIENFY